MCLFDEHCSTFFATVLRVSPSQRRQSRNNRRKLRRQRKKPRRLPDWYVEAEEGEGGRGEGGRGRGVRGVGGEGEERKKRGREG